jgi:hypothetical protein
MEIYAGASLNDLAAVLACLNRGIFDFLLEMHYSMILEKTVQTQLGYGDADTHQHISETLDWMPGTGSSLYLEEPLLSLPSG